MKSAALAVSALGLPLAAQAALTIYSFGTAFTAGNLQSTSPVNIVSASTTFVPGAAPLTTTDDEDNEGVYLWPGLMTVSDEFLYGSIEKTDPASCSASADEWCLTAQYIGRKGLISGAYAPLSGNNELTISWSFDDASGNYTTTASIDGAQVSEISVAASRASAFGLSNICLGGCSAATAEQTYTNTKIVLASAVPTFGSTIKGYEGTTVNGVATPDGGLTWTIDSIVVPQGTQSD